MFLIVGLGNPGDKYRFNKHNIGFMAVDMIGYRHSFQNYKSSFQGFFAEGKIDGERVYLLKPQTFMNLSGQSVGAAAKFYKIPPENVIVIHDELDLDPGRLKVKKSGGHGGHNGLRNIDNYIGKDYWRIRLGIGHPGDKNKVSGYVLRDFLKSDEKWLDSLLESVAYHISYILNEDQGRFMNAVYQDIEKE
jgi:peptidyl-tRNA hydrolase, PTH1 family